MSERPGHAIVLVLALIGLAAGCGKPARTIETQISEDAWRTIPGTDVQLRLGPLDSGTHNFAWHELLRDPYFVPENKKLDDLLKEFQVIVSQNVSLNHAYSAAEVSALGAWIKAGGGFMTLIGYADPSEIQNVNKLLAPHGMSYGPEQILQKQGANTVPVTNWVAHPVTNGVTMIGVDNGYPVNGAGLVLATEQSWNLLRAQEVSAGKVLVWGDEWLTFDSEWSGHPEYQVELLWLNAIKWLTPANNCQVPIPPSIK